MRLDRWLVSQGLGSRREIGKLVKAGVVVVDGTVATRPEQKVSEENSIAVDGVEIVLRKHVYYMMNKPQGVVSATRDNHTPTVLDVLPEELQRPGLFPAGRLDKDTEGFMLITNDGELSHRILSPKNKVPKTYLAQLDMPFDLKHLSEEFSKGVDIGEGKITSPADIRLIKDGDNPIVETVIYEGVYHQIKRMFAAFGLEVTYLKRISIGGLKLDAELKTGEVKVLTEREIDFIFG